MSEFQPNVIGPVEAPAPHVDTRPEPNTTTLPGVHKGIDENEKPLVLQGTPQIVTDLNMKILFSENIDDMKEKVFVIDAYIKNEMHEREMDATVGNYRKVFEETRNRLNIDEEAGAMTQASLLYYYLKGKINK